jgi:hypothetical protein
MPPTRRRRPPAVAAGKKVDAATAGSIKGRVQFEGTVPPAEMIRMSSDRNCIPDGQPTRASDALLVDDGRGVGNTFVYVKEGLGPVLHLRCAHGAGRCSTRKAASTRLA